MAVEKFTKEKKMKTKKVYEVQITYKTDKKNSIEKKIKTTSTYQTIEEARTNADYMEFLMQRIKNRDNISAKIDINILDFILLRTVNSIPSYC